MKYNHEKSRYELFSSYDDYKQGRLDLVKSARFRFEKSPVPLWYTEDPEKASLLVSCSDDDCKSMLAERAQKREESLNLSRAQDADLGDSLDGLGVTPYPFQKAGIAYAMSRKSVLFGDEPGLGKTMQALISVHLNQAYPCVAVVPATLKVNWTKEAVKCIPELREPGAVRIISGRAKPGVALSTAKLWIINYDILASWLPALKEINPKSLIIDESHFAKSKDAARTQACLELAKGIEYKYLLSGTALVNRPNELQSQLEILGVIEKFGGPWGFLNRYCGPESEYIWMKDRRTGRPVQKKITTFKGATRTDEMQRLLREYVMVRRLKDDVLKELPPKRHQVIELAKNGLADLVDRENELEENFNAEIAKLEKEKEIASNSGDVESFEKACANAKKLFEAHFSEMSKMAHEIALAKTPKAIEFITDILEGGVSKIVVWAHHRDVIELLAEGLKDYGVVVLYGGMTDKDKDRSVVLFQNDPSIRVFIGGIHAAGVGITLTKASQCLFVEADWVPGVMDQASDRIHRIGQLDSVLIQYLVLEDSLDSKKIGMLIDKRVVSRAVLDNPLKNFDIPKEEPKPKVEKPAMEPTHVFEILKRLGIGEDQIPF